MYGFLLDQSYINLFILVIIVSIVMFLWRKLIILEGNFFVLEKRVNLIKKDAREDCIAKNIDKADIIMNEIFKDYSPSNACKQSVCGTADDDVCRPQNGGAGDISIDENMVQFISKKSARPLEKVRSGLGDCGEDDDDDCDSGSGSGAIITFANGGNIDIDVSGAADADAGAADGDAGDVTDIDKMEALATLASLATTIGSGEEYENKACIELIDAADAADAETDNMSVCSEITFTTDDKKSEKTLMKKYSKMSLDKLKEVCGSFNINSEGTRNQLIARIIEAKK